MVFAVGRSGDGGARITYGLVIGAERAFRGPRGRQITGSLEHTAPLARGSSGSPIVGLPPHAGLLVRTVAEDSPAATAGIKVGDLLVASADQALATVDDLHQSLDAARATGTLALSVVRGADEHEVEVTFKTSDNTPGE